MSKDQDSRNTFQLLWSMVNEVKKHGGANAGSVIGRYASMLDDRINNSGHSRSTDSLKLYSTEQLQEEINERESDAN